MKLEDINNQLDEIGFMSQMSDGDFMQHVSNLQKEYEAVLTDLEIDLWQRAVKNSPLN